MKKLNKRLTPIASAVGLLVLGASISVQAQQAPAADQPVEQVTVVGVRAALEKSLVQKRSAAQAEYCYGLLHTC